MRLGIVLLAGWFGALSESSLAAAAETGSYVDGINESAEGPTLEKGNLVVVPIPLSNPTMGAGLQVAMLYLHPKRFEESDNPTSGLGAVYTDTDSWMVSLFHQDYLLEDRLRVSALTAISSFKLKFFGFGGEGILAENPLDYSMDAGMGFVRAQYRLPGTKHWYAGPSLFYSKGDISLEPSLEVPLPLGAERDINVGGAGLGVSYDSRDNNYYPRSGLNFTASRNDFGRYMGSDFDYGKNRIALSHYVEVLSKVVLATNAQYERTTGQAPFFARSSMALRGYNRGRYMDDVALTAQAEGRYKFRPRWGVVVFLDYGWISDHTNQVFNGESAYSFGSGLHWQTTVDKPLHIGVDVAFTKDDDTVVFIQLGERF